MTDWIDKLNADRQASRNRQERRWQIFEPMAGRLWEALVSQIKRDADKLNATGQQIMKGEIKINNREIIPMPSELHVDNLTFPAIYLTINLETGSESIKISQTRKETIEGNYRDTNERLQLDLTDDEQMIIKDANGRQLSIEQVSEYILRRFLDR